MIAIGGSIGSSQILTEGRVIDEDADSRLQELVYL